MSFLRSASRAGAVVEPASSLSVVVCSGVSTSAARLDFLAIVTSIKSCERNEAIIAYLVTVLMERTTSSPSDFLARFSMKHEKITFVQLSELCRVPFHRLLPQDRLSAANVIGR